MKIVFIISLGEFAVKPAEDTIKYFDQVRSRIVTVKVDDAWRHECFACSREDKDVVIVGIIAEVQQQHQNKIQRIEYKREKTQVSSDWLSQIPTFSSTSIASGMMNIEAETTRRIEACERTKTEHERTQQEQENTQQEHERTQQEQEKTKQQSFELERLRLEIQLMQMKQNNKI